MDTNLFDSLVESLSRSGPSAAILVLIEQLTQAGDFHRLFEARTLLARQELGLPLLSRASCDALDPSVRAALEERLVSACREIGCAMLESGDISGGYQYLQMIDELEPVRAKIEAIGSPSPEELGTVVEIAVSRGVHPERGIQLILEHYGLCQAITACESIHAQGASELVRESCVRRLIRAAHRELALRVTSEVQQREAEVSAETPLIELIQGRDWLFENENYHLDTSHLNAIVRMARILQPCEEMDACIELCEYGRRLSGRYRYPDPPPFEDVYEDSLLFFEIMTDRKVESGMASFRQKAERCDPREVGTYPMEVYLHLLSSKGRHRDALDFASKHVSDIPGPIAVTINEICRESGDYERMAEFARARNDPVSFLVAAITDQDRPKP